MIRPLDTITLAMTKLRIRKVRLAFTILVSGLLFGLLLAVILISSGILQSLDSFGRENIGKKYITATTHFGGDEYQFYNIESNNTIVTRAEQIHAERISAKKAEAKRLGIEFNPTEDPVPTEFNKDLGKKVLIEDLAQSPSVLQAVEEYRAGRDKPFDIDEHTKNYDVKRQLTELFIQPEFGTLAPMPDGKEDAIVNADVEQPNSAYQSFEDYTSSYNGLSVADDVISMPYAAKKFDPKTADSIPIIINYNYAEKTLGFEKLPSTATANEKLERIREVREKSTNLQIDFCYRNNESLALLNEAMIQKKEMNKNKDDKEYVKPSVIYKVPADNSCGSTEIISDTRTTEERNLAQKNEEFARIFDKTQDPLQLKMKFEVIGLAPSAQSFSGTQSVADGISALLASAPVPNWLIPAGYFQQLPAELKPVAVFGESATATDVSKTPKAPYDVHITEFSSLAAAKSYLEANACFSGTCEVSAQPHATNSIILADVRGLVETILLWITGIISFVAIIILGSMIGRTIADGRKETAVFRAIGAKRIDIVAIYSWYTILLSLRVIVFVALLGVLLAFIVNYWLSPSVTPMALTAFSAQDLTKQFVLIGFNSPYLIYIPVIIICISLVAMLPPLLMSIRRNPINDMRQE
ncbi:MAG: hypothetical protein UY35_C0015G0005 [Candidatus Saccharibacteria bacterium GW2011_GWC2_48_9]|nr:MAG: hypothetical protein UY35_C0015G0005 [Candidatus Saccharibacteria bacterium GW2011_GWC2_48_9]HCH34517.1 hypothetical protein [Candidatus Saccharibacteria bacterium]